MVYQANEALMGEEGVAVMIRGWGEWIVGGEIEEEGMRWRGGLLSRASDPHEWMRKLLTSVVKRVVWMKIGRCVAWGNLHDGANSEGFAICDMNT